MTRGKNKKVSVFKKASPAEGRRRLHKNTAYAHLWGFSRKVQRGFRVLGVLGVFLECSGVFLVCFGVFRGVQVCLGVLRGTQKCSSGVLSGAPQGVKGCEGV